MKKILLTTAALLALTAGLAMAQGDINLGWTDCPAPYGTGLTNLSPACNSNLGANVLVASFMPPVDMLQFNGHAGVVDLQVAASTLDPWWHLETGGCRVGKLTGSFDFTAGPFSCLDVWAGLASGGINLGTIGTNRLRIRTVCAVPGVAPISSISEYYVFKLTISNAQTVGPLGCAGCLDPACIVFNNLLLTQPAGVGDYVLTTGPLQYVTWRAGTGVTGGCPAATPTRNTTWGTVKALYR